MIDLHIVNYTVGWFPSSLELTEDDKRALASERNVNIRHVRGSYRILGARTDIPFIQEGRALRDQLDKLKNEFFLPDTAYAVSAEGKHVTLNRSLKRQKGNYVIDTPSIAKFEEEFGSIRDRYLAWGAKIFDYDLYQTLREEDRKTVGDSWDVLSRKYPTRSELAQSIYCSDPAYIPFNRKLDFSSLPQPIAERAITAARDRLNATSEGIVNMLTDQFVKFVTAAAKSCSRKEVLRPRSGHGYDRLIDAEVLEKQEDGNEISLTVKCLSGEKETIVIDRDTCENILRPQESESFRKLFDSTFEHLLDTTQKISRLKQQLPDHAGMQALSGFAEEIESILKASGENPADIGSSLRSQTDVRDLTAKAFDTALTNIRESSLEERISRPLPRRRGIRGGWQE